MFCKLIVAGVGFVLAAALSSVDTDTAYLDRALEQYREKIVKDGHRRAPVEIKATLIPRPDGFENPKNWTTESALRLMYLIQENKTAASVYQTLRKMLASSTAARSPEVTLRGMEEQASPMAADRRIIQIDNHVHADLPSRRILLDTIMDLLLPEQTAAWLKSVTSAGSTATSPVTGRGGGGVRDWTGGSGGWGGGGFGGWGGGGSNGWGEGGSGGGGNGGWGGSWSNGGGGESGGSSPGGYYYYYYYNGTHWVHNHSGTPSSNYGKPEKPGQNGRPAGFGGYYKYHNGTHWITHHFGTPSSNNGSPVQPAEPGRRAGDGGSPEPPK